MQDNKAEHPAGTRAACQLPENKQDRKSGRLPRPPAPHYAEPEGGSDAVRRQVIQIAAGFARTRRRPLSFPGFPDDLLCPGFPGVGLPDSGHATGWVWLARSSFSTGVSMPGDEWRPRRFRRDRSRRAGRGGGTRPRCGPGACPRARPAGSITASGRLAVTPAARAGSPLRPRRFTTTVALRPWSPSGTGRTLDGPVSMRDRVPGRARAPGRGVRSSRTRWPSRESSSCRAVSQPHGFRSPRVP